MCQRATFVGIEGWRSNRLKSIEAIYRYAYPTVSLQSNVYVQKDEEFAK